MATQTTTGPTSPVPSVDRLASITIGVAPVAPEGACRAVFVTPGTGPVEGLDLDRQRLAAAGFDGSLGSTLVVPTTADPTVVAVGVGAESLDAAAVRTAAAAFARAARGHAELALPIDGLAGVAPAVAAQVAVEGVLLSRYSYDVLRSTPKGADLVGLTVVSSADEAAAGAERGRALSAATWLARDLANTPHSHLNATRLGEVAVELGEDRGLTVEVFDKAELVDMGCGGLLGVNQGSTEAPRMIKLTYRPEGEPTGHLGLVGKGIMYDSGGIALKPGDEVHAQMKNDMSGAAAILAAMAELADIGCRTEVTAYLMCTDNMPSGTALALGDVITMRGGTTVEVINTDAEGRLVMADALVLATEDGVDAIVDIATLTGACMRALGTQVAGVIGNNRALIDQVREAAEVADEPVWQLPLERRYRTELDSTIADLKNLGGANAGAITAALFLAEFVGDVPWAHIDIAGTAQSGGDAGWQTAGCTGFGARLLVGLAETFSAA
ncbi:MAG TPA: leucyl aminopeptidase [Iamia sp.]